MSTTTMRASVGLRRPTAALLVVISALLVASTLVAASPAALRRLRSLRGGSAAEDGDVVLVSRGGVAAARTAAASLVASALADAAAARTSAAAMCGCASKKVARGGGLPKPVSLCPGACSGHGVCRGMCECADGYGGPACDLPVARQAVSPLSLLTVVTVPGSGDCASQVSSAMANLPAAFRGVRVVTAAAYKPASAKAPAKGTKMKDKGKSPKYGRDSWGGVVNTALSTVDTKYAIVLTGDMTLSDGMTPGAVVDAMRRSGLVIAGGMVETSGSGGGTTLQTECSAIKLKNYTVSTLPSSWHAQWGGCLLCDHTSNSFVVDVARFNKFSQNAVESRVATLEAFMRAARDKHVSVGSCPLAIQFKQLPKCTKALTLSGDRLSVAVRAFTVVYKISHWGFTDGTSINFCGFGKKKGKENKVQGRCKYDHQHQDLNLFVKHLKGIGVKDYAVTEGVMLSALKFRRVMPWDYDIDLFAFVDGWDIMKKVVSPPKFKAKLKKDHLDFKFARAQDSAIVFTARWRIDIDTYFIVLNTDASYKANTRLVKETLRPLSKKLLPKPNTPGAMQDYNINWRNVVTALPEEQAGHPKPWWVSPTADIWFHGTWTGIRRYNFPNLHQKYGAAPALLHVTRAMGKGVGQMFEGRYGEKALTYRSHYCKDPTDTGCLDGWVWFQDWEGWYPTPKALPGAARAKQQQASSKPKKKKKKKKQKGKRKRL